MMDITERELALVSAAEQAARDLEQAALAFRNAFLDARIAERRGHPAPLSTRPALLPPRDGKMVPVPQSWLEALAAFVAGDPDGEQRQEMAAVIRRHIGEYA